VDAAKFATPPTSQSASVDAADVQAVLGVNVTGSTDSGADTDGSGDADSAN
jgi:hypothetical protein